MSSQCKIQLCIDSLFAAHSHWPAVCLRRLAGVNGASKIAHGLNLSRWSPKAGQLFPLPKKGGNWDTLGARGVRSSVPISATAILGRLDLT